MPVSTSTGADQATLIPPAIAVWVTEVGAEA